MYLRFQLFCDWQTQLRIHKALRTKVQEWKKQGLIERCVLTYHTANTPHNLYVCLDITNIEEPKVQTNMISEEILSQIPSKIINTLNELSEENKATMQITDFTLAVEANRQAYGNAPTEDILNFASVGTEIAFRILNDLKYDSWRSDWELAWFIRSRLEEKLGKNSPYLDWRGRHFVCNPLGLGTEEEFIVSPIMDHALRKIKYLENL